MLQFMLVVLLLVEDFGIWNFSFFFFFLLFKINYLVDESLCRLFATFVHGLDFVAILTLSCSIHNRLLLNCYCSRLFRLSLVNLNSSRSYAVNMAFDHAFVHFKTLPICSDYGKTHIVIHFIICWLWNELNAKKKN